jgi:hypothetical protein
MSAPDADRLLADALSGRDGADVRAYRLGYQQGHDDADATVREPRFPWTAGFVLTLTVLAFAVGIGFGAVILGSVIGMWPATPLPQPLTPVWTR